MPNTYLTLALVLGNALATNVMSLGATRNPDAAVLVVPARTKKYPCSSMYFKNRAGEFTILPAINSDKFR
jgi:hypothetical protein